MILNKDNLNSVNKTFVPVSEFSFKWTVQTDWSFHIILDNLLIIRLTVADNQS